MSSVINWLDTSSVGLFSDFQYGFRSSRSTADFLTAVTDRIGRALNLSGATRVIALDISKVFDRVWHNGLLHKLTVFGITDDIFQIIFYVFLVVKDLK